MAIQLFPGPSGKCHIFKVSWSNGVARCACWSFGFFFGWNATPLLKNWLNARKIDVASKMIGCWMVLDIPPLPNVFLCAVEEKHNKEWDDHQISGVYSIYHTTTDNFGIGMLLTIRISFWTSNGKNRGVQHLMGLTTSKTSFWVP